MRAKGITVGHERAGKALVALLLCDSSKSEAGSCLTVEERIPNDYAEIQMH